MKKILFVVVFVVLLSGCYDRSISKNCGQGYKMEGCSNVVGDSNAKI